MAKRHPVSRRSRPAPPAAPEDMLVEKTLWFSVWAREHRQTVTLAGIALAAVLIGTFYYVNFRGQHLEQAAIEFERVQQNVLIGDTAAAKIELAQHVQSFGDTPYAGEARLLLGLLYLETSQADEAVAVLQNAVDMSDPLGLQAAILLAKAHEQSGELEQAEQLLLRVADRADLDFQVQNALTDAARLRRERGDPAGAADLYQRILDELEDAAPQRGVFELRLEEARTAAKG